LILSDGEINLSLVVQPKIKRGGANFGLVSFLIREYKDSRTAGVLAIIIIEVLSQDRLVGGFFISSRCGVWRANGLTNPLIGELLRIWFDIQAGT